MKKPYIIMAGAVAALGNLSASLPEGHAAMTNGALSCAQDVTIVLPQSKEEIAARVFLLKQEAQTALNEMLALVPKERTFANTVGAFDQLTGKFSYGLCRISAVSMVSQSKDLRDAATAARQELVAFSVDTFMSPEIYQAFKAYGEHSKALERLTDEQEYCFVESMQSFEREGFNLPTEQFEQVKALSKEISDLGAAYNTHIREDASSLCVAKDDLAGVDEAFLKTLQADEHGMVTLKADYPTRAALMPHCSNASVREHYSNMFNNRAYPENIAVLEKLIAKRDACAKVLGFESFAHSNLAGKMAKDPIAVEKVLRGLLEKAQPKMHEHFLKLTAQLPEGVSLTDEGKLRMCDSAFVNQQYSKKHFKLDPREVAEYFPIDSTIDGLFSIYQKFLGLTFAEEKVDGLWDETVRVLAIRRKGSDKVMGYIALDLYPREGKYSHACNYTMLPAIRSANGEESVSFSLVIANFPAPSDGKPSLLKHGDVTTFFHEFGHAMHSALGYSEFYDFSGTSVKRDFVETPSQMFEEWMWDRDMLKMISSHYETGEALPDAMIDAMLEKAKFGAAGWAQGQSAFALLALLYFKDGAEKDTAHIMHDLFARVYRDSEMSSDDHFQASFGHLVGYGAGYYGYVWSKIFALDLFSEVKKHGLLDEKIGKKLVDTVLSKGGSKDPNVLMKDFLGREVSDEAFLECMGLL